MAAVVAWSRVQYKATMKKKISENIGFSVNRCEDI